jgi:NADPH-dependent 2,4-dienoyl-CoA reductase/sulfur reductase-like enzyme
VSTYVHRYGVLPGRNVVVFTNNDRAYQTALDLKVRREGDGRRFACVVERRAAGRRGGRA